MTEEIIWKDPPKPKHLDRINWTERLRPLTERPGKWALVEIAGRGAASSICHRLKNRIMRIPLPSHEWEFTTRQIPGDKNKMEIYARYLGPTGEGES